MHQSLRARPIGVGRRVIRLRTLGKARRFVSDNNNNIVAVISDTYSDYHKAIVTELSTYLADSGFGTLCVAGHGNSMGSDPLTGVRFHDVKNHRELADFDIAGHIVLSGSVGHTMNDVDRTSFFNGLSDLPTVSLGVDIPGVSSVIHHEEAAMEALMEHLTDDPKRQRFVFLRGFTSNADSQLRESVFRRCLANKSIAVDQSLIIDGNFAVGKAYSAMCDLLKSGVRFDAVVAANDVMAGSAIRALNEYGLSVPEDVIVSGFDGSKEAATMHPPLTTINQDNRVIAEQAVEEFNRLVTAFKSGEDFAENAHCIRVDCELVIRSSTGGNSFQCIEEADQALHHGTRSERLAEVHQRLITAYSQVPAPSDTIEQRLTKAVVETLSIGSDALPLAIAEALSEHPVSSETIEWWRFTYRVLALATEIFPADLVHPDALALHVNSLTHVGSTLWAIRTRVEFDHEASREALDSVLLDLASTASEAEIFDVLERGFDTLNISCAWIRLYETVAPTQESTDVVFAVINGKRENTDDKQLRDRIAPENVVGQHPDKVFVHFPLQVGKSQLGYLVVDPSGLVLLKLEAIAAGISQAFRHCWQIADLEVKARGLREINESLSTLARFDSLTNLPNRKQFHEFLDVSFEYAKENGSEVGLLFFDLDGFKRINDTLGHSAGDHLLRIVANRVSRILRSGDKLCRLGGDEFTVIISESVSDGLFEKIANRILEAVSKPCTLGNQVVNVSASIGMAAYPRHGEDLETLIRNADTAMYHAKANGKNCVAWYTSELNSEAISQLKLDQDMRIALADDMFHMHYQPRVCLKGDTLIGFEALMRWQGESSEQQFARPDQFIPVAEQTGFISDLENFALKAVCEQASIWFKQGFRCRTAINLSAKRLQEATIVDEILGTIAEHQLSPEYLEFEVTESAMMADIDGTIQKLKELRKAGIHLSIDDFGTGYSSMNYLKQLPVTSLKIDRSFLIDITDEDSLDSADASIVRAVVALGKSLGFLTVAEGVENEGQLNFLKQLGCDEAQGYFYSPPLSVADATDWLRRDVLNSLYKLTGS